jgi:hypothetical protein
MKIKLIYILLFIYKKIQNLRKIKKKINDDFLKLFI